MKLRIFLPPADRAEPATPFTWKLFDARGAMLRQDSGPLDGVPRARRVEAVLPAERVLIARLALPRVNAATIRELLPFAVEDRLLADPAHVHAVAGRTTASGETVVAVVDREWLRSMVQALRAAGLEPARAWCESELLLGRAGEWHLAWSATRGLLVDDDGVSASFDHGSGMPLALRIAIDEAGARGAKPRTVHVHAVGTQPLPDLAAWSAETGVSFAAGPSWESVSAAEAPGSAIDLLADEGSRRRSLAGGLPRAALVLGASIAALQLAFTAIDAWRLSTERSRLEARREELFRSAFPEAKVVVDPVLQMSRNLAELRRSRGIAAGDEFLAELGRVAREARAPVASIEFRNGKATVR